METKENKKFVTYRGKTIIKEALKDPEIIKMLKDILKEQNEELKQKLSELDDVAKKDKVIVLTSYDNKKFLLYVDEILSISEAGIYSGKKCVSIKLKDKNPVLVSDSFETLLSLFNIMEIKKEQND